MTVKLVTEQHLEFLSLNGGCTNSSESTLVKMPHCWKSHIAARIFIVTCVNITLFRKRIKKTIVRVCACRIMIKKNIKNRVSHNKLELLQVTTWVLYGD